MIEYFDTNWFNGVVNTSCLSTTKQLCYSNSNDLQPWAIAQYCNSSMNMLTEDICYDWYVNSVYPDTPVNDYYNSSRAIVAFDYACNEYPWHDKCKCKTILKEFNANSFTMNSDPSQVYNVSCLFPSCSVQRKSYNPAEPTAFIPYDIVHDKSIVCPSTICTNIIKDSTIVANDTTFNLKNVCNAEDAINSSDKLDIKAENTDNTNSSNSTIIKFIQSNKIILIAFVVLIIVILIIIFAKSGDNKNNDLMKMILLKKMLNKKNE